VEVMAEEVRMEEMVEEVRMKDDGRGGQGGVRGGGESGEGGGGESGGGEESANLRRGAKIGGGELAPAASGIACVRDQSERAGSACARGIGVHARGINVRARDQRARGLGAHLCFFCRSFSIR
jgi:hypothetical protein